LEKLETAKEKGICVDTDILVDFLRRREPGFSIYNKHKSSSYTMISSVTAFELLFGGYLSTKRDERLSEVNSMLEQHVILSFDSSSANQAASIAADIQTSGKSIEIRDLFNAGICISADIPVLTRNKSHYERVKGLKLITS